jgi:hypothetical protein
MDINHGDPIDLDTVIGETAKLPGCGMLGVHLSVHALPPAPGASS